MLATIFVVIFGVLMGLIFTFFGLRVFLVLLPVWGFFAGFWLGAQASALVLGSGFVDSSTGLLVGLVLGIICAILSYRIFEFGVVLVTAVFGIALGTGVLQALGLDSGWLVVIGGLIIAVVLAWLLFRYDIDRYLIMVLTALGGASLLVGTGLLVFERISLDQVLTSGSAIGPILSDSWIWSLVWLAVAIAGIAVQLRAHRGFDFRKHDLVQGWS